MPRISPTRRSCKVVERLSHLRHPRTGSRRCIRRRQSEKSRILQDNRTDARLQSGRLQGLRTAGRPRCAVRRVRHRASGDGTPAFHHRYDDAGIPAAEPESHHDRGELLRCNLAAQYRQWADASRHAGTAAGFAHGIADDERDFADDRPIGGK